MKRFWLVSVLILLTTVRLLAQGCHSDILLKNTTIGGMSAIVPAVGSVNICLESDKAVPCTTTSVVLLYSDSALTKPISNPVPTDSKGNFSWCAVSATYNQQPTGSGITTRTTGPITISPTLATSDSSPHNFTNIISESKARIVQTGLLAEYSFKNGSGFVLSDVSGKGNNGSVISGTWITGGGFTCNGTSDAITLPAGLSTTAKSVMVFQQFGPFNTGGMPSSLTPAVVASTDPNGIYLKEGFKVTDASTSASKMTGAPALMQTGATTVGTFTTAVGWHMITADFTTPTSTLYVDDSQILSYYTNTGVTLPQLGQFQFCGSSAMASSFWKGNLYYAAFYDHSLTATEVGQNYRAVLDYLNVHGVNMAPVANSWGRASRLMASGDSITENDYEQYMGPLDDPSGNGWAKTNDGVSGSWTYDVLAQIPLREATQVVGNGARCVDILFAGTNNINGGMSVADTTSAFFATARSMKKQMPACKLILGTMLSRTGFDASKNAYNSTIRTRWQEVADGIADFAADPNLGCDGCSTNLTYFQDGVHPTLPTGETLLANIATNSVNAVFGTTFPTASTVAAPTYTELAKDVWLNASASANSVVITMPPSVGYTGMTRCIRNVGVTATTNTVTVVPSGTETFESAQTSFTIPGQSTTCFIAVMTNPSTPTTQWQRTTSVPNQNPFIGTAFTPSAAGSAQLGNSTNPWSGVQIGTSTTNRSNVTSTATAARAVSLPDAAGTIMIAPAATTTGRAACIKGTGQIGYCSTQPDATGACTCN